MSTATKTNQKNQVFALWKRMSKEGKTYFTGKYEEAEVRAFYNSKKQNPKEPDMRIYVLDANKNLSKDELSSLWCNVSKSGKKYLTGKLNGKRVVGFINVNATAENKQPYISLYWSEEKEQEEQKKASSKKSTKTKKEEPETTDDLPF